MTAVMAVEINNESAASLIQSVTVHNFQSAPLPDPSCGYRHVANVGRRGRNLHRGRVTETEVTPGTGAGELNSTFSQMIRIAPSI